MMGIAFPIWDLKGEPCLALGAGPLSGLLFVFCRT